MSEFEDVTGLRVVFLNGTEEVSRNTNSWEWDREGGRLKIYRMTITIEHKTKFFSRKVEEIETETIHYVKWININIIESVERIYK